MRLPILTHWLPPEWFSLQLMPMLPTVRRAEPVSCLENILPVMEFIRLVIQSGEIIRTASWNQLRIKEVLADHFVTFAEVLQENGYRTASMGKWHLGADPTTQGFDVNIAGKQWGSPSGGGYPQSLSFSKSEREQAWQVFNRSPDR